MIDEFEIQCDTKHEKYRQFLESHDYEEIVAYFHDFTKKQLIEMILAASPTGKDDCSYEEQ